MTTLGLGLSNIQNAIPSFASSLGPQAVPALSGINNSIGSQLAAIGQPGTLGSYPTSTLGYDGNNGPYGTNQTPSAVGTGTYQSNPYAINDNQITGANNGYYGQAGVSSDLQNLYNANQPLNVQATAPTVQAAMGQGAQGGASSYQAAQGGASSYNAAQSNAAAYQAAQSQAAAYQAAMAQAAAYQAQNMGSAGYTGAQGNAASSGAASGQAALANGYSQMTPASMLAAQQGYATAGQTGLSTAGDAAWQAQQAQLANTLQTQASGGGVSPADLQLLAGGQQNTENQLAVLGSQMGGSTNTALAMRSAADQAAASNAQTNQAMGIQRAQETLNAQNSLGSVLGTARGQAQAYNATAAGLAQQANLANAGYANTALANNAALAQAAGLQNSNLSQSAAAANMAAGNNMLQYNVGQQNTMLGENMSLAEQTNLANAQNAQNMSLANMSSNNAANQFTAGQLQASMAANQAAQNAAAQYNASNAQAMNEFNANSLNTEGQYNAGLQEQTALANQSALNAAGQYNAGLQEQTALSNQAALNAAGQYNAGNAQAMTLANMASLNQAGQYNAGNAQAMTLANMGSQNQFTAANIANQQAANLANQSMAGQYGLANASNALASNQQYQNFALGALGAQTGISQNEASAGLANQQLQVQQQNAINQINQQAYQASAINNANLTGGIASGVAGIGSGLISSAAGAAGQPTVATGPGGGGDGTYTGYGSATGSNTTGYETGTGTSTPVENDPLEDYGSGYQQFLPGLTFPSVSDENLKTGVEGGNPMMQSFLSEVHESQNDPTSLNVNEGVGFKDPTYGRYFSGGSAGSTTGSQVGGAIGSTGGGLAGAATGAAAGAALGTAAFPGIGTAIGGLIGGIVGSFAGSTGGGAAGSAIGSNFNTPGKAASPKEYEASAGSGYTEGSLPNSTELESPNPYTTSQSDDRAKTAIASGNQGIQAFLQSQGAQQQANAAMGTQNNAFDQIAGPAPTVADRPMPNPNAGYGALNTNTTQGYYGNNSTGGYYDAGYTGPGGMTSGGYQSGGWQGGGWAPGQVESMDGSGQAGYEGGGYGGGGYSSAGAGGGGYSSAGAGGGGYQSGGYGGGGYQSGGINQSAALTASGESPAMMRASWTPTQTQPSFQSGSLSNAAQAGDFLPLQTSQGSPMPNYSPAQTQPTFQSGGLSGASQLSAFAPQNYQPTQTQPTFQPNYGALSAMGPSLSNLQLSAPIGFGTLSDEEAKKQVKGSPAESEDPSERTDRTIEPPKEQRDPSTVPDRGMAERDPSQLQSFLDSIHAHQYKYKDPDAPGAGHGTYVSPMAQEIEKTPLGEPAVSKGPDGYKRVDYGKLLGTMLAGQAFLNERTNALESMMKARHG